ncbi:hypothetical protein Pyrde_1397 [Pyrodictium delaneyi]|uniref:4-vinyl reductase 4VR domain-containing protein n=1 Tax=Pyrodictium delaneyi TaxID=1273541 RepID=A0A0P0N4P7_9CREN|nr:V4R domain-containing protein [Pyrodictium delaneyi]ALL01443.1 hypothetical protein Pyrde_1397 [Pyrodictium delaneyi]OWJ54642.1 hypothetical protein Pdsh_06375 [Pyrodictium delaneyi]
MSLEAGAKTTYDIKVLTENAILIDRDVIVDIYTGFEKVLRFVGGLLYTASKRAGKLTAERLEKKGILNRENALDLLFWSFTAAGYADRVEIVDVKMGKKDTEVELRLIGTLLGSRLKGRKRPVDQPLAGYIAGWLEHVYGHRVDARETKCAAKGDDSCIFNVKIHGRVGELAKAVGRIYKRTEHTHSLIG